MIDKQQLRDEYLSGIGTKMLAKRFGVSRETVRWQLRKMGILGAEGRQWKTGRPKLKLDGEELKKQYLSGKSLTKLSKEYGHSCATIRDRLLSLDVEIDLTPHRLKLDDEQIGELYLSGVSVIEMSRQFGCSDKTIHSRLDDATKETRRQADAKRKEEELCDLEQKRIATEKHEAELIETAKKLYLSGLSAIDVAQQMGYLGPGPIVRLLDIAGVERRPNKEKYKNPNYLTQMSASLKRAHERGCYTEETRRKISESSKAMWRDPNYRNNHPNWRGGISYEPYGLDFNAALRKSIRTRDHYACAICNEPNSKTVHHVDYDKQNNFPGNLLTLCTPCHAKTNTHRRFWQTILAPIAIRRSK